MEEFTAKDLMGKLGLSKMALSKALSLVPCQMKEVEGSAKPVKHYKFDDLPQRYKDKLEELGLAPKKNEEQTDILKANFTKVYLLASPDKQEIAVMRCKLIKFYLARKSNTNRMKWLKETLKNNIEFTCLGDVSERQLDTWLRKYKEAEAAGTNLVEIFIDKRGGVAGAGVKSLDEKMKEVAIAYFIKDSIINISEIYLNMKHKFGELMPSYDVLNRFYKDWKDKNPVLYEFAKSPDGAKNKLMPAIGNASEKVKYKNHYWELDSTPADVICADGKRYSIMAAIDVFTRRAVFHVAESSNAYSITQLLRKAILKLGIPDNVVIDNGKDYTSNHFMSVCYNLKINPIIVPPFSGDKKPHIERLFGTLSRQLFMQVPGFIGANVAQRTQIQARQSFAQKINSIEAWRKLNASRTEEEKRMIKDAWKIKKENLGLRLEVLKTHEELQDLCDKWLLNIYEQEKHGSLGISPVMKWNRCPANVKSIPNPSMLNLLLGESLTRKVVKKGVQVDGLYYWHDDLFDFIGQSVFVLVPDDMGSIFVHKTDMQFICIAEDPVHTGQSRAMAKKAAQKWNALTKHLDKMLHEAKNIADITIIDRIEAVKDRVETHTIAVTKRSAVIDAVIKNAPVIEASDLKALQKSNKYDFKNKDEEGKPQKVLESGRPLFKGKIERFIWVLEHPEQMNEKDKELMEKYPDLCEIAKSQAKVG
ncbi:MAG: DDE-type integrase/transposase/recombinase [Arcobacter sp.]|uniref:DDE-type integrase/transposase/recombinase n=1 Tax=Arcobacter sp. TaxID=1872629 RepID=UPI003D015A2B